MQKNNLNPTRQNQSSKSLEKSAISVVIPTFNARHLLEKHLPNVVATLHSGDEIIVVDDASTDDTVTWLKSFATKVAKPNGISFKTVVHSVNQRFAAAVNTGVDAAKHHLVLLINNDVSPLSPNFRQKITEPFANDPQLFSVGCAEVTSIDESAPISGRGTGDFQRGMLVHWFDEHQNSSKTLWTSGGSMMFDSEKFLEIHGMDTLFAPAYEEDRDLSYRAVKHGWKIRFLPSVRVLHQHETTNTSVFGKRRMEIMSWKNQFLLVWKNITDRKLILLHIFWLPYHLTITNWRSNGALFFGFLAAIKQWSEMLRQRKIAQQQAVRTDSAVLAESK